MNFRNTLKSVLLAILATGAVSCVEKEFNEITALELSRCLQPQNLTARVNSATGDDVTFSWDVSKDAGLYELNLFSDEGLTSTVKSWELLPAQVPFTAEDLTADQEYWYSVKAYKVDADGIKKEETGSNVAVYDGSFKTFAVKGNLFPEVSARSESSITLKWDSSFSDYKEVTHITCRPVKGGSKVEYTLTDADKAAASATVSGLAASTEYQITVYYLSASRGALDAWTMADKGAAVTVSNSADLLAVLASGGEAYLTLAGSPYEISSAKPKASVKLFGEIAADGSKPEVIGKIELTDGLADGSTFYAEGIKFNGGGAQSRVIEHTGAVLNVPSVTFKNCEITNYMAGLFYDNNDNVITLGSLTFEGCDIYSILGSGGDAVDIRKPCEIGSILFNGNTIYDGMRTFFRIDANDAVKIGSIDFENNTVKGVSVMNDGNNQGLFAIKVATEMTLKNNIFLWEDGGITDEATPDKAQLFRDNTAIVVPTLTASGNWTYAHGKDFFTKVSASEAGFTVLNADPCFNSKGNFFQLTNEDLVSAKAGAPKWWNPYVQKEEDLTQGTLLWYHTWNLLDAKLFAGEIKNSRVRDELLLVGTEATPLNADNGINFLGASVLNRKGIPTEGYLAFKIDRAGSVDLQVEDPENRGGSVVVALADDNGYAVKGGAVASAFKPEVQKVLLPDVKGEATVYLYATGPVSLTKLAWSSDVVGGDKILATPKPTVEPVTITEGDETPVTISWDGIVNAVSYVVVFNKRAQEPQTELSFTVPAEDVAALKAGLYNFSVQALPREDDIYHVKSEAGVAALAIQPKGGGGEMVEVTKVWDFSQADWQAEFAKYGGTNTDITNWDLTYDDLTIHSGSKSKYNTTFFQFGGKSGDMDRYFKFNAPEQGTLKITVSNTGSSEALDRTVQVAVGDDVQAQPGGYPSTSPTEIEFSVKAGEVIVTAPVNGLRFYKLEFNYTTGGGAAAAVEYDWNFSDSDWVALFESTFSAINNNEKVSFALNGLDVVGVNTLKYNVHPDGSYFIQMGGKGKLTERCFQFDAPAGGTISVWATNTGDSDALDRTVAVAVDGTDVDSQPGGYAKKDGAHQLDFIISAGGRVTIYGPVNGLCFYHIHYISN
jgi:hypothetical protein